MVKIKGIIPPIITPMNEDETINEQELRRQVNRLIDSGVHGLFPLGTNGEGYILDNCEKERILSVVIEENRGRVPVYAGTGCISTKESIRMSKLAEDMGADVLSIITPWFAQASEEELYEHYKSITANVKLPVVLYNIPARTGNTISPALAERLSHIDNIAGVKDSSGNFDMMLQFIERTRDRDFAVLSGNDSLILWNLIAGGSGGIAGCANLYPETMVAIYERFRSGDLEGARAAQDAIRSFRNCFRFGNPNTIVKTAVAMSGHPVGSCRAPFNHISEAGLEAIRKVLEENRELGVK